jgi:chromosome segregation ATPase
MLTDEKKRRFQCLRQHELDRTLTKAEQSELLNLVAEIENAEAVSLAPATARLRDERKQLDAQNRALAVLVQRKAALVNRLRATINELETEQRAINEELAHILGENATLHAGVNR